MTIIYKHEPFTDFSNEKNKQDFEKALAFVQSELGKEYPVIIGGERFKTVEQIISYNPAVKEEVIGTVSKANQELS